MKVFSYGGGVQSTAALVLAAQSRIDYQMFLFCNTGDDSENPDTLRYVEEVAKPFAEAHGIELIELSRENETLYGRITGEKNRGYVIPCYTLTKDTKRAYGAPTMRNCTRDFKVEVVAKWLKAHGATKDDPAIVGLGISLDEADRANSNNTVAYQRISYPLLDELPRPIDRQGCLNIIHDAGLPIPPKSACFFCPYHSVKVWQDMREKQPELFHQAVQLEQTIQDRQVKRGLPMVYLSKFMKPLDTITTGDYKQEEMFGDICESGYCFV